MSGSIIQVLQDIVSEKASISWWVLMRGVKQSLFGDELFGHVCVDGVQYLQAAYRLQHH